MNKMGGAMANMQANMPAMGPGAHGDFGGGGAGGGGQTTVTTKKKGEYPVDWDGTPVGLERNDEVMAKIDEWMESGIASFDDDKIMVVKCSTQSYVFTTQQAGQLMSKLTWDKGQAELAAMFNNRLLNPEDGDPILDLIDSPFASEKEKLQKETREMLKNCKKAEVRENLYLPAPGNDGVRDDGVVDAFVAALADASFDKDRDQAIADEIANNPP